ncbi:MAG: hypothetical protein QNJ45_28200, partial [Ardenticatenaceae bacterium]|nr:hypothetical protein [Ardenticatenaceae bacterium]
GQPPGRVGHRQFARFFFVGDGLIGYSSIGYWAFATDGLLHMTATITPITITPITNTPIFKYLHPRPVFLTRRVKKIAHRVTFWLTIANFSRYNLNKLSNKTSQISD